ncbi:MAG: hypothetical protein E7012_05140 [Alphaproteobacteria bacterium]|nr:hypothetical protein [Alphaproteobacteria bacterium]
MNSPFALLSLIVILPFLGMLFVFTAKDDDLSKGRNSFNVCVFTILANITLIWRVFMVINERSHKLQLKEHFDWLTIPDINIVFGVDTFSLLLILTIHLGVLIGLMGVWRNTFKQKSLMVFTLLFLSMSTGFFVSADIFSFYIFFEAMLLPVFLIIGMFGEVKKQDLIYRYFLYNFIGALLLFSAIMLIYHKYGNTLLADVGRLTLKGNLRNYIWVAIFLSFISRIPIWPFHYWISSINVSIRNPLAFIITALMPLTAIYGFIRFLPTSFSSDIDIYLIWMNIIGVITMLFIALIGFINRDAQYKIFSYLTVYYITYLLGVFSNQSIIRYNIGYSLFGFIVIISALEVLSSYIYHKEIEHGSSSQGFLCRARRLSLSYSFMVIAAIGLPFSAVFVNNYLILSNLLGTNIYIGMLLIFSVFISGIGLLQELFRLKQDDPVCRLSKTDDISLPMFILMIFVIFMLIMSFIRPLWFVINE